MPIAFISHSSQNKALAEELFNKLGANNCVLDKYTFEAGHKTINEIFDNLDRTDLFVLIISNASLNSNWVNMEVNASKERLDQNQIRRFLPINIDRNITHTDPRIPAWIRNNYNLKSVSNQNIIVNKIQRQLREIILEQNPKLQLRIQQFVGRNFLIEEFEDKYINIENLKPTSIIISGLEGTGRRTFLRKALEKNNQFSYTYEPAYIILDLHDTIDDLIVKLDEGYTSFKKDFISDLLSLSLPQKIAHLTKAILEYLDNHEFIFFIDNGCLIRRTGEIQEWFIEMINQPVFSNRIAFCLISKYRPLRQEIGKAIHKYISQQVGPLSDSDKEKLFIKLMNFMQISFENEKMKTILAFLNGLPEQIFYAAELIKDHGIDNVIKMKQYILDYNDNKLTIQFSEIITTNNYTRDIVILISKFETISYDYLSSIFTNSEKLEKSLEYLYTLGAYELVGMNKGFLKMNHALADYITRNQIKLSHAIEEILAKRVTEIIDDKSDIPTYSDVLNTIKEGLIQGRKIPQHLLLPSLALKSIQSLYDKGDYQLLISLANSILENSDSIESRIIYELHYFLCLSYAREKDTRFQTEIHFIEYPEKNFLFGLYNRIRQNYVKAKSHLTQAVTDMPNKIQARSELVLTLLSLEDYQNAESLAKENYNKHKTNPFYIQAYFKCILVKSHKTSLDIATMNELINRMDNNPHPKAKDMSLVMNGEYDYYVNHQVLPAINKLKQAMNNGRNKSAVSSLIQIYKKQENFGALEQLKQSYPDYQTPDEY